jgi:hypothetical protein
VPRRVATGDLGFRDVPLLQLGGTGLQVTSVTAACSGRLRSAAAVHDTIRTLAVDEMLHLLLNLVANRTDSIAGLSLWIEQWPIKPA